MVRRRERSEYPASPVQVVTRGRCRRAVVAETGPGSELAGVAYEDFSGVACAANLHVRSAQSGPWHEGLVTVSITKTLLRLQGRVTVRHHCRHAADATAGAG